MTMRLRYSFRRLSHARWFTATAIVTLAIGIGACTAMFSIVRAVLLQPIGVSSPDRVVVLWPTSHGSPGEFPFATLRRLRAETQPGAENVAERERDPVATTPYEQRRELAAALDLLPPDQRQALILHFSVGMTVPEIAEAVAAPFETVRSRLRLAKATLRETLKGAA